MAVDPVVLYGKQQSRFDSNLLTDSTTVQSSELATGEKSGGDNVVIKVDFRNKTISNVSLNDTKQIYAKADASFSDVDSRPSLAPLADLGIAIDDQESTRDCLDENAGLIHVLTKTVSAIRRIWTIENLRLECIAPMDDELDLGSQLTLFVVSTDAPDDAFSKLQKFDSEFWLRHCNEARGKLVVNVDLSCGDA